MRSSRSAGLVRACVGVVAVLCTSSATPSWGDEARERDAVFKFSFPKPSSWSPIPLQPDETKGHVIRKYAQKDFEQKKVYPEMLLVLRSEGRTVKTDKGEVSDPELGPDDLVEALRALVPSRSAGPVSLVAPQAIKSKDGVPGRMWSVEGGYGYDLVAVWTKPGVQYAMWLSCDFDQMKRNLTAFPHIVRGFQWTDDRATASAPVEGLKDLDLPPKKRKALEQNLVKGWAMLVSPKKQYVVVYNTKGKRNDEMAKLIAARIEQIRADLYEPQFPPKTPIDAVSVVRICGDVNEYVLYGGSWDSAGYWSWHDEELVLYDASPGAKLDDDTLAVAYHEAFHQYVYYGSGQMEPHSWFNEGHGDYYAGARPADGKFVVRPFDWRVKTVKASLRKGPSPRGPDGGYDRSKGGYVPLADFLRFSRDQYYEEGFLNYAQGWSLIYFLREVVPTNPAWQAKWGKILDTYYLTLRGSQVKGPPKAKPPAPRKPGSLGDAGDVPADDEEMPPEPAKAGAPAGTPRTGEPAPSREASYDAAYGDVEAALKAALKGVDLEELEAAWVKSILQVPG